MKRRVAVALPVPIHRTFTYLWPADAPAPARGVRVRVPFGKRTLVGIVMDIEPPTEPANIRLRAVTRVIDREPVIEGGLLSIVEFAARYYVAPIGEMLRTVLPTGLGDAARTIGPRPTERVAVLTEPLDEDATAGLLRRAPRQAQALDTLRQAGGRARLSGLGLDSRVVRALVERGWVTIEEQPVSPTNVALLGLPVEDAPVDLNAEQAAAFEPVRAAVAARQATQFLLFGVTGSGKTEIYLRAAQIALDAGRGVLLLVPEIGLTPALVGRLSSRFGDGLAVLHSRLSRLQRAAHWHRIRAGEARIVVGARSAVFAPLTDLGIIVVDEEQDSSYKQEERPRYHARDMALVRGRQAGCPVVLVSATPSLESYARTVDQKVERLVLGQRVSGRPLPVFEVVDLREEFREQRRATLITNKLMEALEVNHAAGGQAMLLLNRRGWASFLLCRACGEPVGCGHCSVSLTYHHRPEGLMCHYCGRTRQRPTHCPHCAEESLQEMGSGTERIEDEITALLPALRVLRMDADTVRGRYGHVEVLARFARGEADVLVGTQMIAKGHDFPGVTLVGVLGGDSILSLPDFRAAEWTFQLVTQVAGRAGRGENPGRVILQAFRADHYALRRACEHDFVGFFEQESRYRRSLLYPPYVVLAAVRSRHRDADKAAALIGTAADRLRNDPEADRHLRVLGPAPAPLARLRERFRFHLLIKARSRSRLTAVLTRLHHGLAADGVKASDLGIDVDPMNLL